MENVETRVKEVPRDTAAADVDADVAKVAVAVHRVEQGVAQGPSCDEEEEHRDDADHRGHEVVIRRRRVLLLPPKRVVETRVESTAEEQVAELLARGLRVLRVEPGVEVGHYVTPPSLPSPTRDPRGTFGVGRVGPLRQWIGPIGSPENFLVY